VTVQRTAKAPARKKRCSGAGSAMQHHDRSYESNSADAESSGHLSDHSLGHDEVASASLPAAPAQSPGDLTLDVGSAADDGG